VGFTRFYGTGDVKAISGTNAIMTGAVLCALGNWKRILMVAVRDGGMITTIMIVMVCGGR